MPCVARSSFMGDDAEAVSRLVAACQRPDFSNVPVVERTLQPYFSDPEEEEKAVQEVQRKLTCNSGRKNIRSGSPITSAPQPIKGSRPHKVAKPSTSVRTLPAAAAGSPPRSGATSPANMNRAAAGSPTASKTAVSLVSTPKAPVAAPVPKTTPVRYIVKPAASAAVALAACPAIFKSPKPSDLPMPSSALLRRLALVTGPVVCMLPPAGMPVMAAA